MSLISTLLYESGFFIILILEILFKIIINIIYLLTSPIVYIYVRYSSLSIVTNSHYSYNDSILITGGGSGIGLSLAHRYLQDCPKLQNLCIIDVIEFDDFTKKFSDCKNCSIIDFSKEYKNFKTNNTRIIYIKQSVSDKENMYMKLKQLVDKFSIDHFDMVIANAGLATHTLNIIKEESAICQSINHLDHHNNHHQNLDTTSSISIDKRIDDTIRIDDINTSAPKIDTCSPLTKMSMDIDKLWSVNINGVINTIFPLIEKTHRIVLMSSLGSFSNSALSPEYFSSKSAIRLLGEGLRPTLEKFNIQINVISPGFFESVMTKVASTDSVHPLPFLMSLNYVTDQTIRAIDENVGHLEFPVPMYFGSIAIGTNAPSVFREFFCRLGLARRM